MKKVLALVLSVLIVSSLTGCRTTVDRLIELKDNAELARRMANGVTVVLEPDVNNQDDITSAQLDAAAAVFSSRLDSIGYWNAEVHVLEDNRIGVILPKTDDLPDVGEIIDILTRRAVLEFRYMYTDPDDEGNTRFALAMEGTSAYISKAAMQFGRISQNSNSEYYVELTFTSAGSNAFREATRNAVNGSYNGESISNQIVITIDDEVITAPNVSEVIDSTVCIIHGRFDDDSARELANLINSGSLPFGFRNVEIKANE